MAFTLETIGQWMKDYWYIFIIFGIFLLLLVFSRLDSYTKRKIGKLFTGPRFIIIAFFIWWVIWGFIIKGNLTIRYAHYFMPLIGLICLTTFFWVKSLMYYTDQIQSPNFHASISEPPILKNGFLIYGLDTIAAGGIHWPFAERILVVRQETAELLQRGSFTIANVSPVSKYDLPVEVVEEIDKNPHLKKAKEFFYGWFDNFQEIDWEFSKLKALEQNKKGGLYEMIKKELKVSNPKISTLFYQYMNLSKSANKLNEYYKATIEVVDTGTEHFKRTKEAYQGKDEQPPQRLDRGSEEYHGG